MNVVLQEEFNVLKAYQIPAQTSTDCELQNPSRREGMTSTERT
jgi:hypothetical protein